MIISLSVVGLMWSSSAAFFWTPPRGLERGFDVSALMPDDDLAEVNPLGGNDDVGHFELRVGADVIGNQIDADLALAAQHDRTLDDVLELPHVTRPVVREQPVHRVRA